MTPSPALVIGFKLPTLKNDVALSWIDPPAAVPLDRPTPLVLEIAVEPDMPGRVALVKIDGPDGIGVSRDLAEAGVTLGGGEAYRCSFTATFRRAGPNDLSQLRVQVGLIPEDDATSFDPDTQPARRYFDGAMLNAPAHPLAAVPNLLDLIDVEAHALYVHPLGRKVEVTISRKGRQSIGEFSVEFVRESGIRSGVLVRRLPDLWKPDGRPIEGEFVASGDRLALDLRGTIDGQVCGPLRVEVPIAATVEPEGGRMFRFLEPKKLARDGITLFDGRSADGLDAARRPIGTQHGGYYPVRGGESRYLLIVRPTDPLAVGVEVHRVPGKVEPTPKGPAEGGGFATELLVNADSVWTNSQRVYYDLLDADGRKIAQGEFFLLIAPTRSKRWIIAATAGAAVALKSLIAIIGSWTGAAHEARTLDWAGLLILPGTWAGLLLADVWKRGFEDV